MHCRSQQSWCQSFLLRHWVQSHQRCLLKRVAINTQPRGSGKACSLPASSEAEHSACLSKPSATQEGLAGCTIDSLEAKPYQLKDNISDPACRLNKHHELIID